MFRYKGKSSKEMHLRVLNDVGFTSPTRDVNAIQVPGRDGDLMMDNGRFNSVVRSIPCRIEAPSNVNVESVINDVNNWLIDDGRFHEFGWDSDPEFKYLARVEDSVSSQRVLSRFGTTTIDFRLHPIKYLRSSLEEQSVRNNDVIENPFNVEAKPLLRVSGMVSGGGDLVIEIGGRPLVLRGMAQSGCVIDSETQTITDPSGRITLFEIMRSPFPVLKPGANVIRVPAGVTVAMAPRLGRLV